MIKVRVIRGAAAAVTGASGIALIGGAEACAVPAQPGESVDTGSVASAFSSDAGTGTLALDYTYYPTFGFNFTATNTTDEFVRVGEKMSARIPAYFIWSRIHPADAAPEELERATKLQATVTVTFLSKGAPIGSAKLTIQSWLGQYVYDLVGVTNSFVVPERTDALTFDVVLSDRADRTASEHIDGTKLQPVYVFGGDLPNKHAIFDNDATTLRTRIVEGGSLVEGSDVTVTYTDWRANTVVDTYSLDRQIGTAKEFGRFGQYEMPISGDLAYEVSYGYAFDDAWHAETALAAGASHLLLGARTAYETTLHAPAGARKLSAYFHVKVYLVVDYSRWNNVTWRRYNQGDRILLRDRYDNRDGVAFQNYELPIEAR
jgi:hypothetical protein